MCWQGKAAIRGPGSTRTQANETIFVSADHRKHLKPDHSHCTHHVNGVQTDAELKSLRHSLARGTPFGDNQLQVTARKFGLECSLRPQGSPKQPENVPHLRCPNSSQSKATTLNRKRRAEHCGRRPLCFNFTLFLVRDTSGWSRSELSKNPSELRD